MNWFLSGATKGVTALNTGVKSIEQEINTVLTSRSVTPDINTAGQLLTVLNKIKAEAVLAAHPVGSLYWTSKKENPAVTFGGGTWKQITDKFVLAAGSTYKAESTGGASTVILTVANLPSHNHSYTPSGTIKSTFTGSSHSHTFTPSGSISDTTAGGRISYNGGHTHIVKDPGHTHKYLSGSKNETDENGPGIDPNRFNTTIRSTGIVNSVTGISIDIGGTHTHDYYGTAHTHTFTGKKQTVSATQGGTVASSFTGTAGTTGSTTQAGTVASTFTGTSSSTGSVGSATAVNVLPPYIVKYCWERTA
ncbi:hypothetical protein [uncultured Treponema sp.]|uniref:phage baseplate protein n=1 Tax=uncultured Treponema sp. TaxID=162155 RepID=UPI0027D9C8D7|nr:hypothetical protein [uncultured Treponema sp.]